MNREKTLLRDLRSLRMMFATSIFIALGSVAPLLHNQLVVGVWINALLFTSVQLLGLRSAIFVGLFPSLIAYAVGLLPFSLVFVIPFILLSNLLLVTLFHVLKEKPYAVKVILCSVVKFLFLFGGGCLLAKNVLSAEETSTLLVLFGTIQLVTALLGGALSKGATLLLRKTSFFRYFSMDVTK